MVERAAHNRLVVGPIPTSPTGDQMISGYRIAAIMSPCQGLDTGSTPVTRSLKNRLRLKPVFWYQKIQVRIMI